MSGIPIASEVNNLSNIDQEKIVRTSGSHNCGGRCIIKAHVNGEPASFKGSMEHFGEVMRISDPMNVIKSLLDMDFISLSKTKNEVTITKTGINMVESMPTARNTASLPGIEGSRRCSPAADQSGLARNSSRAYEMQITATNIEIMISTVRWPYLPA